MKLFLTIVFLLFSLNGVSQEIVNSDFSMLCIDSETELCNWELSWGKNSVSIGKEKNNTFLQIKGNSENSVGFVEQAIKIEETREFKIIEINGLIKSDSVIGKGAGLNLSFYDKNNMLLSSKDMGGFYSIDWIKDSQKWKTIDLKSICPIGTVNIKVGLILYGQGKVGFDDISFSLNQIEKDLANDVSINYLNEAISIIKENSLYRDSLDFKELFETAGSIAGNAEKTSDVYLAIEYIISQLIQIGDHHSFFMKPEEVTNWENPDSNDGGIELPTYRIIQNFGYINVPPFHGGNDSLVMTYIKSLQEGIKRLSEKEIHGWIIDLRENTGGNMEPMIAGLGPLFSDETLGSLVDINGNHEYWSYKNGAYFWEDEELITVNAPVLLNSKLPISVLISDQTGSSGEIVTISFIGNTNTKLFGEPTWGLTTGNGEFELSDGAKLLIASTKMVDRNGKVYNSTIEPDIRVLKESPDQDLVLLEAIKWLESQEE